MDYFQRTSAFLAFLLINAVALAQPKIGQQEIAAAFPNESAAFSKFSKNVEIFLKNGELSAEIEMVNQLAIIKEAASFNRSEEIPYDEHFLILKEIEAGTWLPNGSSFKFQAVKEMSDVQSMEGSTFYDSKRYKKFVYPAVSPGTFTECKYKYFVPDGVSLGSMTFELGVPVLDAELVVTVPTGVELGFQTFGEMENINYTKEQKGKSTIHRWVAKNIKPYKSKNFLQSDDRYRSSVYVFVRGYQAKKGWVDLFGTSKGLYEYNFQHIKQRVNEKPSAEIMRVVDSIKTVYSKPDDIARASYYWVQDHIRYIAFEYGLGGLIPRPADQVCQQKFGDCKDMANLLYSMLSYAGLPVYHTWIGTREIDFNYTELACPYSDNHMIATYKDESGKYVYLDATSSDIDYGFPSIFTQGKEAMIAIDATNFDLGVVPIVSASTNLVRDVVDIKLVEDNLIMTGNVEMHGFVKSTRMQTVKYKNPVDQKLEWLDILERGNNKNKLLDYKVKDISTKEKPVVVDYVLEIPDYVKILGDEMYINFNFDKAFTSLKPDTTDRKERVDYEFTFSDYTQYKMTIPEGYVLKKLPDNVLINTDYYQFDFRYKIENNQLIVEKSAAIKTITIPNEFITNYMTDLDKISQSFKQVVTFKKKA
ncbi:MAG: DUF3857 domain-containing protein [Flavobacteriales bacterium]|jgi:hypothetical protein